MSPSASVAFRFARGLEGGGEGAKILSSRGMLYVGLSVPETSSSLLSTPPAAATLGRKLSNARFFSSSPVSALSGFRQGAYSHIIPRVGRPCAFGATCDQRAKYRFMHPGETWTPDLVIHRPSRFYAATPTASATSSSSTSTSWTPLYEKKEGAWESKTKGSMEVATRLRSMLMNPLEKLDSVTNNKSASASASASASVPADGGAAANASRRLRKSRMQIPIAFAKEFKLTKTSLEQEYDCKIFLRNLPGKDYCEIQFLSSVSSLWILRQRIREGVNKMLGAMKKTPAATADTGGGSRSPVQTPKVERAYQSKPGSANTAGLGALTSAFTHIDVSSGRPQPSMVDVTGKEPTLRTAHARATVLIPVGLYYMIDGDSTGRGGDIHSPKGPVFSTAIVAGTMAVKNTSILIPFCHPLPIESCKITITPSSSPAAVAVGARPDASAHDYRELLIDCYVKVFHKTGVEMEALTGCTITALTVYDMCKAITHDMVITNAFLVKKTGGKSSKTTTPANK